MTIPVMVFNSSAITDYLVLRALRPPVFAVYRVALLSEALRSLREVRGRVVVIIDHSAASVHLSEQFIEAAAQDGDLAQRHTYVLLVSTDETLPMRVSKSLSKLSFALLASSASEGQIVSVVQIVAQRQPPSSSVALRQPQQTYGEVTKPRR